MALFSPIRRVAGLGGDEMRLSLWKSVHKLTWTVSSYVAQSMCVVLPFNSLFLYWCIIGVCECESEQGKQNTNRFGYRMKVLHCKRTVHTQLHRWCHHVASRNIFHFTRWLCVCECNADHLAFRSMHHQAKHTHTHVWCVSGNVYVSRLNRCTMGISMIPS